MAETRPLYSIMSGLLLAIRNCEQANNLDWKEKHVESLLEYEKNLPSGSGIDAGTKIDLEKSNPEKIVLCSEYHLMDENGMYGDWIDFQVIITPSLYFDIDLRVTGRFKGNEDIKDHLYQTYDLALREKY